MTQVMNNSTIHISFDYNLVSYTSHQKMYLELYFALIETKNKITMLHTLENNNNNNKQQTHKHTIFKVYSFKDHL